MRKRQVLFLTQYLPPESGAGARRAQAFLRYFQPRARMQVVCGMPNYPSRRVLDGYRGRLIAKETVHDAEVKRLRAPGIRFTGLVGRSFYEVFLSLLMIPSALRSRDAIIVTIPSPFLLLPALVARKLGRTPLVIADVRDLTFLYVGAYVGKGTLARASAVLHLWMCKALKQCDLVLTTSSGIRDELLAAGVEPHCVRVVVNGADEEFFRDRPPREESAVTRFVYAGLVGRASGVETFVKALAALPTSHRHRVQIVVVGDGPCLEDLRESARDLGVDGLVEFKPPVGIEGVPAVLASADVALVALRGSGVESGVIPAKLCDALASGLPVLFAGGGEGARIVAEAEAGVIVDWAGIDQIAGAMLRLVDAKEDRLEMGLRGRAFADKHLRREAILRQGLDDVLDVPAC